MTKSALQKIHPLSLQHGIPSYWLQSDRVELFLSELGGHLGPVRFKLKHRWVSPYALAPWKPDEVEASCPSFYKVFRGDCFSLPYGVSKAVPCPYGESANRTWNLKERTIFGAELQMLMDTPDCKITKHVRLKSGQRAVFHEHIIEGLQGRYSYGHHTVLEFPHKGSFALNTSAFDWGQVNPEPFGNPAAGSYSCLQAGAKFMNLGDVQLATGGNTSLQTFPAREGYDDLVMVVKRSEKLAWTAVTLDGYIWFTLKLPAQLPATLLWFSHGGRHAAPWFGRHRFRLGIHEVHNYFADGLEAARRNPLCMEGISTVHRFNPACPTSIRLIQAVHPVASSFGQVASIEPVEGKDEVQVTNIQGQSLAVPLSWNFLTDSAAL